MNRRFVVVIAAASLGAALGCTSKAASPVSPSASGAPAVSADTGIPASSLKATVPVPQSPSNGQQAGSLTPTLVASASAGIYVPLTLQYRFQVFNDAGDLVLDSGPVNAPTWTTPVALTPVKPYTWKVRAEYQGTAGAWSAMSALTTPVEPSTYNRPIGNWEACGSLVKDIDLVTCVFNAVKPDDLVSDFEVTKRVAWLQRGKGGGLLTKTGEGTIAWQGHNLSVSRVCFPDGHIFKIFADAGTGGTAANAPIYSDNDFVDPSLYVPAIDPSKP